MRNVLFSNRSLALTAVLLLTGNLLPAQNNNKAFDTAKSISVFNSVLKELNTLYVDTFDLDEMVEKGINTMLYTLDPYTTYIPETEAEDFKFMTTGEYGGIGSLITYRDSFTYIAEPYEGLPAQVHGLKAGDKILQVDSVSAVGLPSDKVSEAGLIDIALKDQNGRERRLTDLKGKVVLLDFTVYGAKESATRNMMLRELYDKYQKQGLEIYQIAFDDNEHFWKTSADNLPWICVRDAGGAYSNYLRLYNVARIPTYFLISRGNELKARQENIKDLETEVKKLL